MENEKKFAFLKKRRTAFAFVLWLLAMTLLVALFIAKKDEVKQNLEDARVFNKNPPIEAQTPPAPVIASTKDTALFPSATENEIAETAESSEEIPANSADNTELVNASLCFVATANDSEGTLAIVERAIPKSDSPMMAALNAVIAGTTESEAAAGCQSLIPEGTELLGATVQDGVAILDFNDAFEFNNFGFQGTLLQLMQIVYTATAFPTVNSVQILINGEKREYLGSEGVFIGVPLTRESFEE